MFYSPPQERPSRPNEKFTLGNFASSLNFTFPDHLVLRIEGGWVTLVWMRFVLDAYLVLGSRPLCALTESRQLYTGETWTSSACRMNQRISFFLRLSSLFSFPPACVCTLPRASSLIQRRWVFSGVDSRTNPRPIDFRESQHCYSRQIT